MRIDKRYKLAGVAAKEATRYAVTGIWLTAHNNGWACATDGRMAALVPAEVSDQESDAIIPAEAIAKARTVGKASQPAELHVDGHVEVETKKGPIRWEKVEGKFPALGQVCVAEHEGEVSLALNAELLARLAAGLGSARVRLRFQPAKPGSFGKAIIVEPLEPSGAGSGLQVGQAFGLLMPVICPPKSAADVKRIEACKALRPD